eukprot:29113-Amphidinium_carterae.2
MNLAAWHGMGTFWVGAASILAERWKFVTITISHMGRAAQKNEARVVTFKFWSNFPEASECGNSTPQQLSQWQQNELNTSKK